MNKEYIAETALKSEYKGKPQTCIGTGAYQDPSCGDVLTYYFSTDRELITSISYTITEIFYFPSKACTETTVALVGGRPALEAYTIGSSAIVTAFGGLEPEYMRCAMTAELALKRAILDYAGKQKEGQPVKATPPI